MHAMPIQLQRLPHGGGTVFVARVGGRECTVRSFSVSPVGDLLGFEGELEAASGGSEDATLLADALESRMIAPPRPRRRRDRAVSSRAAFYASGR